MTTNNNIEEEEQENRLESSSSGSSNNTCNAQVQNRYEVCIYEKQTRERDEESGCLGVRECVCVCMSLLVEVLFTLPSTFRFGDEKRN